MPQTRDLFAIAKFLVFQINYVTILYCFRDIAQKVVKNSNFYIPRKGSIAVRNTPYRCGNSHAI